MTNETTGSNDELEFAVRYMRYRYPDNPQVVYLVDDPTSVPDEVWDRLPAWWLTALTSPHPAAVVVDAWRQHIGDLLPRTLAMITTYLGHLRLIHDNGRYALIYLWKPDMPEYDYIGSRRIGYEPLPPGDPAIPDFFTDFPQGLRDFYTHLHNGWDDFGDNGPRKLERLPHNIIGDLFDPDEYNLYSDTIPLPADFDRVISIASDARGHQLLIDLDTGQAWNLATELDPDLDPVDFYTRLDEFCVADIFKPPYDRIY